MRSLLTTAALLVSLSAGAQEVPAVVTEAVTSTTTFAVCKTVDVATTAHLLSIPGFREANPLTTGILNAGGIPALIAVSVGIYYLLKEANSPVATGIANVTTCGVAAHNLLLLP